jgi:xanthine dehydrogenase small subunit
MYHISFFLNGQLINTDVSTKLTALYFLRNFGLTGTKEGCSEGDCGACTIVIGENKNSKIIYQAVNSCLMPAVRMHGKHIVTIEGLGSPTNLHPIQKAILDYHGVQCGYCTPGIIMSLFTLFLSNSKPSQNEIYNALEGNLCRCTGYESIKNAAIYLSKQKHNIIPKYFKGVNKSLLSFNKKIEIILTNNKYFIPQTVKELFNVIKNRDAKIINGGSDIMVDINIKKQNYQTIIDISEIKELNFIKEKTNSVLIGATTTLSDILSNKIIIKKIPVLYSAISQLGSMQIRNIGTLAGNIANASPIADATTALLALNSKLILKSSTNQRKINLSDFIIDYKKTVLRPKEIIFTIEIPITDNLTSFEKSAKRKSVDIASVSSAVLLKSDNHTIKDITIAFGGVAPIPIIAKKTCDYLKGKKITTDNIKNASLIACAEVKPISDLRGSEQFRRLLVRNHIIKHFARLFPKLYENYNEQ